MCSRKKYTHPNNQIYQHLINFSPNSLFESILFIEYKSQFPSPLNYMLKLHHISNMTGRLELAYSNLEIYIIKLDIIIMINYQTIYNAPFMLMYNSNTSMLIYSHINVDCFLYSKLRLYLTILTNCFCLSTNWVFPKIVNYHTTLC